MVIGKGAQNSVQKDNDVMVTYHLAFTLQYTIAIILNFMLCHVYVCIVMVRRALASVRSGGTGITV